jgi:hypothetical protein
MEINHWGTARDVSARNQCLKQQVDALIRWLVAAQTFDTRTGLHGERNEGIVGDARYGWCYSHDGTTER